MICIIGIGIILLHEYIYSMFMKWLADDENGLGRLEIFKSFTYSMRKNIICGLGPGAHAYNGTFEYHNTYLEILAMSGVLGFIVFLRFSITIFKKMMSDKYLLLCIIPLYAYGFAGFAMRRLIYWGIIAIALVLSEKKAENKTEFKE